MSPATSQHSDREWKRFKELLDQKRVDEAEMVGRLAQSEFRDESRWLLVDAWIALVRGKPLDALRAAETAARAAPYDPAPLRTIASALLKLDKPAVALEAATAAFQLEPSAGARALIRRAQALLRTEESQPPPPKAAPPRPRPILDEDEDETLAAEVAQHFSSVTSRVGGTTAPVELSPELEGQLHALFGTSLFGPWQMQVAVSPVGTLGAFGRQGLSKRQFAIGAAALLVIGALALLLALGLRRSHERQLAQLVASIERLMRGGSMVALAESLPQLDEALTNTSVDGEQVAVAARAHATLYRYHDADRDRLTRARELLERIGAVASENHHAIIARAVLLPTSERAQLRAELDRLDTDANDDPEVAFTLATILRSAGETRRAEAAYERAERLEPSNLYHSAESIGFYHQLRRRLLVANLVEQMRNINPMDPWTRWAEASTTGTATERLAALDALLEEASEPAGSQAAGEEAPVLPPLSAVLEGRAHLESARLHNSDPDTREHLEAAFAAVDSQRSFVLDYFDLLVSAGQLDLAKQLTEVNGWPSEAGMPALARLERLSAKEKRTHRSGKPKTSGRGATGGGRRGKRRHR